MVKQLISYCGSASEVFRKPPGKLVSIPGVGNVIAQSIRHANTFREAENEFKRAASFDTQIIFYTEKQYPSRLKSIDDAPTFLYFKGTCNLNHPRIVAIVGTRQATLYGKKMVEQIIDDLLPHQALILSGLAYGIDIHAHKHALKNHLATIGVMGSGIDVMYPADHSEVARKMMDRGGIISENPFGTKPDAHNFPSRNRIIAGLCDALIVVEAAETGGALITADIGNSYNKDIFAVPGSVGLPYSAGCNQLIKSNKANLFTSVKDLEYMMNWVAGESAVIKAPSVDLSKEELQILDVLTTKGSSMHIDELAWKSGLPFGTLSSTLLQMEFKGAISALPGKMFSIR